MPGQPSSGQRVARVYRRLRSGARLTARDIAALVGYGRLNSAYRLMLLLESEDADIIRDAAIDGETDKPILVWYLRQSSEIGE